MILIILILDSNIPEEQALRNKFSELSLRYPELASYLIRLKVSMFLFLLVKRIHIVQGKHGYQIFNDYL